LSELSDLPDIPGDLIPQQDAVRLLAGRVPGPVITRAIGSGEITHYRFGPKNSSIFVSGAELLGWVKFWGQPRRGTRPRVTPPEKYQ